MSRIHPGLPGAVVRASSELYEDKTGKQQLRHGINWTLPPETISEFRQGYRCALPPHGCGAAQHEAFPEKCIEPYCNFNLRRDLIPWLDMVFEGELEWPTDDGAAAREHEREQHEFYARKAGVILPPGVKL